MYISRRGLFLQSLGATGCAALGTFSSNTTKAKIMKEKQMQKSFMLYPVGKVEKKGKQAWLRIFEKYTDALKGLDGYSHVFVMYWFDRNDTEKKRSVLQVHPRGNKENPLTGVFACRAPVRPNLIALSLCKVLSVEDGVVHIDKIDALDGTPILDLKPYIPSIDSAAKDVRLPTWLKRK